MNSPEKFPFESEHDESVQETEPSYVSPEVVKPELEKLIGAATFQPAPKDSTNEILQLSLARLRSEHLNHFTEDDFAMLKKLVNYLVHENQEEENVLTLKDIFDYKDLWLATDGDNKLVKGTLNNIGASRCAPSMQLG